MSKKLNTIIESHITTVQKQKRVVAKCHQDNEAAKQKYQVSVDSVELYTESVKNSFLINCHHSFPIEVNRKRNQSFAL